MTASGQSNATERKSRWIPWIFVGLFGVFLTANCIMIYIAATTWTGLTAKSAYRQGVEYNRTLDKRAAAKGLGWEIAVGFEPANGLTGTLQVRLRNRDGEALNGAKITGATYRPVAQGNDFALGSFDSLSGGRYATRATFPKPGLWEIRLKIVHKDGTVDIAHRLRIDRPGK